MTYSHPYPIIPLRSIMGLPVVQLLCSCTHLAQFILKFIIILLILFVGAVSKLTPPSLRATSPKNFSNFQRMSSPNIGLLEIKQNLGL